MNLPKSAHTGIGAAIPISAKDSPAMKARVTITLKNGVLDPQGKAIHHALDGLGFGGVNDVRAGKMIELDLADGTSDADIEEMCKKLLANTVIENYRIERA
jgi:phosphoribosylformylglycinamidine synthase